jgi:hypothetical protein
MLIIIHTSLTICYILGYKTKYTAPLFWFFTCSIQWANPLFTNAGSDVARLLIWWSIFLPINKIYSLDSGWKKAKTQDYKVSNIATLGIGLQVLSIYFFSYFLKTSDARRTEFSAIYYALSRDYFFHESRIQINKLLHPYSSSHALLNNFGISMTFTVSFPPSSWKDRNSIGIYPLPYRIYLHAASRKLPSILYCRMDCSTPFKFLELDWK